MTITEQLIIGLLITLFWIMGIFMGYNIGEDNTIDNLCNKSQYDFCHLVSESKQFKIKEGYYNEN